MPGGRRPPLASSSISTRLPVLPEPEIGTLSLPPLARGRGYAAGNSTNGVLSFEPLPRHPPRRWWAERAAILNSGRSHAFVGLAMPSVLRRVRVLSRSLSQVTRPCLRIPL